MFEFEEMCKTFEKMSNGERKLYLQEQSVKMINAFELMKYVHSLSIDEERIVSEGLSLFCKYFRNLWT